MAFLDLPRELRDKIYTEALMVDEPVDIMVLLRVSGTDVLTRVSKTQRSQLALLDTCHQIRDEALVVFSEINTFRAYDDSLEYLGRLFDDVEYETLRSSLDERRLNLHGLHRLHTHRIRHLHISMNSTTPDGQSSQRILLRSLAALAHEVDGKGYVCPQASDWPDSLSAYATAAILPSAAQLRLITIDVGGFWLSESRQRLLDVVSGFHALGNITFRFELAGKCEEDVLYGRQAIDRSMLEQCLSQSCGHRVVIPSHGVLLPHEQGVAQSVPTF